MQTSRRLRPWRSNAGAVASFLALPGEQPEDLYTDPTSSPATSTSLAPNYEDLLGVLLSSANAAVLTPALQIAGFLSQMPLQISGYVQLDMAEADQRGATALGEELEPVPEPDGSSLVRGRGATGPVHVEHHEHQQSPDPPVHHGNDDMMVADIGLAMISSGLTVMLAMMGAVCALRICREMLRRRGTASAANVVESRVPEGSAQAFRPFGGQGYRLVLEGDVSKPPTPRMSPSDPDVKEEKRSDRQFPETGLPNFGAGLASLDSSDT
mmetsp:Transcript_36164/g.84681  ORF Transcript_36164/g.84681 Transcript_36164/m.84681 type:complete len:268 (+) Transcript_36164:64-867(+)|eukprot:s2456_g5.t1